MQGAEYSPVPPSTDDVCWLLQRFAVVQGDICFGSTLRYAVASVKVSQCHQGLRRLHAIWYFCWGVSSKCW